MCDVNGKPELTIKFNCVDKLVDLSFYLNPEYNAGETISEIICDTAKAYDVNPEEYTIVYDGGLLGVVYHGDLETLEKPVSEYKYILCGKTLLEKK